MVKEAYARLSPGRLSRMRLSRDMKSSWKAALTSASESPDRTDTLMPVRLRAVQARFIMPSIIILLMGMKF